MENWIGIGVWIVMGAFMAIVVRALVKRPEETPGHVPLLMVLGAFGAVVGGMLGVGIFEFDDPLALSAGGMGGALVFSSLMSFVYRWGIRGLI